MAGIAVGIFQASDQDDLAGLLCHGRNSIKFLEKESSCFDLRLALFQGVEGETTAAAKAESVWSSSGTN